MYVLSPESSIRGINVPSTESAIRRMNTIKHIALEVTSGRQTIPHAGLESLNIVASCHGSGVGGQHANIDFLVPLVVCVYTLSPACSVRSNQHFRDSTWT